VEFSTTQLDNFHASIASSILELRAAMVDKWGPIEDPVSRPSSFLEPMFEDMEGEGSSHKHSKVGVPVPQDLGQHLKAIWALRKPADAKMHKAFRVNEDSFQSFCRFTGTPSRADLDALGLNKETVNRYLDPRCPDPNWSPTLHPRADPQRKASDSQESVEQHWKLNAT
jgi:hypothetical protein